VQLYELFFLLVALGLLWYQQRRVVPGELFWRAVAYLSLVELGVAAFRADAQTWLLGMRMTQVIALAVLLAALYVLSFYARQRTDAVHVDTLETMQPAEGDQAA
jgi:prolipoprotein diacylglyceryltransferase